jgi:predicted enzyme related to lactoylglutathione lyase
MEGLFMIVKTVKEPIVRNLGGAGLKVNNLQKMAEWYGDLLAMPVPKIDPNIPFHIFDMDNRVNLALDDYRNMQDLKKFPICQMKTADIDRAYRLVEESGIPITLEIQRPHPGLAYFNIEDSEGNVLQIIESDWINPESVEPLNPNHPIKNHLNTCIIPVIDLKRATEWYSKLLGYPIKPERQDGGPIYWFEMDHGTGILLDDNRNNQGLKKFPTFMLKASNIHEAYEFVIQNNIEITQEIQFDHFFMIKDLEGNSVMVCQ